MYTSADKQRREIQRCVYLFVSFIRSLCKQEIRTDYDAAIKVKEKEA